MRVTIKEIMELRARLAKRNKTINQIWGDDMLGFVVRSCGLESAEILSTDAPGPSCLNFVDIFPNSIFFLTQALFPSRLFSINWIFRSTFGIQGGGANASRGALAEVLSIEHLLLFRRSARWLLCLSNISPTKPTPCNQDLGHGIKNWRDSWDSVVGESRGGNVVGPLVMCLRVRFLCTNAMRRVLKVFYWVLKIWENTLIRENWAEGHEKIEQRVSVIWVQWYRSNCNLSSWR